MGFSFRPGGYEIKCGMTCEPRESASEGIYQQTCQGTSTMMMGRGKVGSHLFFPSVPHCICCMVILRLVAIGQCCKYFSQDEACEAGFVWLVDGACGDRMMVVERKRRRYPWIAMHQP